MHPSIEHLIHLQRIESDADQRRRWVTDLPQRVAALDARVAERRQQKETAAQQLAENQATRRGIEKELAVVQGRLTKFKDQLMEVKTNREYTAMQNEIATAEQGVRGFEDQMLELMMAADELTAGVKAAEAALSAEEKSVAGEKAGLAAEQQKIEGELKALAAERAAVEARMPAEMVRLFADVAAKRRGLAVTIIKDGHCSACQVRLRPQQAQEIRRGERIQQCESCSRILYLPPDAAVATEGAPPA